MSESTRKRNVYLAAAAVLIVAAVSAAIAVLGRSSSSETTNDAYVTADYTVVAPRVAGQITELLVEDNQVVHQGQLLAQIDDRDYRAAVASAEANVAMAKAAIDNASTSIVQQQSVIDQANAALAAAHANYTFARADYSRYTDLASRGAGSVQNAQQAQSRIDTAQADVARNLATVKAARQQVAVLQSVRDRAQAALGQASAALDTARLNLSWTRIVAPVDGMVGRRSVRLGAYVTAGTPMLAVVPLQKAYVVANFQETQLTSVRRGQTADIHVDTFPGAVLHGTVDSLAPATGVTFAPIAPDNATGNFTKIVQRIPVKILLRPGQPELERLRVGMSVEATIRTGDAGGQGNTGGIQQ
ncbi:HlyD family secretion protein [Paraburkholderia silvatlantica]|uniref:Membrane fusion protein (Multidrug efflux system) n=2 Tax=Paraburkholderia silvatlantica TaxID=321895 RepID=A0A2V4TKU8_9BURK|nr:HlyD family secretion protein [Paraburkholderia silvatlantica]PYE15734.1 membrane fusion protein (multidrug efflux system) [Paraburkholderia silvatlantica]TDQ89418.1 membrane fusion protein (multidrug efflux system) [Paraburkholderia silvatlantica]